jgi:peptidyl-prolyl cis-trans isomerase C
MICTGIPSRPASRRATPSGHAAVRGLLSSILLLLLLIAPPVARLAPGFLGVALAKSSAHRKHVRARPSRKPKAAPAAAMVNGAPIEQVELDKIVEQAIAARPSDAPPLTAPERLEIRKRMLRTLIGRELLLQEARKEEYTATEAEVDDMLHQIKKDVFGGSEAEFMKQLRRDQMTMSELRANLHESLVLSKLKKKIYDGTAVTPEEVKAAYEAHKSELVRPEAVRARNIYVKVDPGATPEQDQAARLRIVTAREEARKSGDFAAAAKKYSESTNASSGGEMGVVTRDAPLMPEMIKVLFSTPPGQMSEPFRTSIGWHVVKVEEKLARHAYTIQEATETLTRSLRIQKTEQAMANLAADLWRKGKVTSKLQVSPEAGPEARPAGNPPRQ